MGPGIGSVQSVSLDGEPFNASILEHRLLKLTVESLLSLLLCKGGKYSLLDERDFDSILSCPLH